jgi:chromosome partitioning protein
VSEAPGYGQSVLTYDPGSRGSTSYVEAAREVAERGKARTPLSVDRPPGMPPVPPVAAMTFGGVSAVDPSRSTD